MTNGTDRVEIMRSLFEQIPFQSHSATSVEAAESMKGKTANIRNRVLVSLSEADATDDELFRRFPDYSPNTIRPRRVELLARGLIEPAGRRATASGRSATVWRAKGSLQCYGCLIIGDYDLFNIPTQCPHCGSREIWSRK